MRVRLRDTPTGDELATMYAKPHQHRTWTDHRIRVDVTTALAASMIQRQGVTVADLSCGDAAIARRLQAGYGARRIILGDIAPGYEMTGPIEKTVKLLGTKQADLFICSETIEHLDDPDAVLAAIRQKTDRLVLSTPEGEDNSDNPEHVWGWGVEDVEVMLTAAGFTPTIMNILDLRPAGFVYSYQIWCCT